VVVLVVNNALTYHLPTSPPLWRNKEESVEMIVYSSSSHSLLMMMMMMMVEEMPLMSYTSSSFPSVYSPSLLLMMMMDDDICVMYRSPWPMKKGGYQWIIVRPSNMSNTPYLSKGVWQRRRR